MLSQDERGRTYIAHPQHCNDIVDQSVLLKLLAMGLRAQTQCENKNAPVYGKELSVSPVANDLHIHPNNNTA